MRLGASWREPDKPMEWRMEAATRPEMPEMLILFRGLGFGCRKVMGEPGGTCSNHNNVCDGHVKQEVAG
jgi:hypothetical protein